MIFGRIHRTLLVLVLGANALWLGWAATATHAPLIVAEFLIDLAALGAAATGRRFTFYPVFLLAALLVSGWLTSIWFSFRIGYFAHISLVASMMALLPGTLALCVALYCCLVAWIFYRARPVLPGRLPHDRP